MARRVAAFVLSTYMQSTPLIARLFLTKSVANHAMIRAALRRRHSRLAAVLTTLVALALEIISFCTSNRQPLWTGLCSAAILHSRET